MGNHLSYPATNKFSQSGADERFLYAVSEMQGWRITMEDAHTTVLDLEEDKDKNNAFFAIYDGHGGRAMAMFAAQNLHRRLLKEGAYHEKNYELALKRAFLGTDEDFLADPENTDGGCTAVVALITQDGKIYLANAGDSRSVLSVQGEAKPLSVDHKPENEVEQARILKANGLIEDDRVNGFALSRALGDFKLKKNTSLKPEEQIMTANPDITVHDITSEDEFLVLACDGIWDCLSSQEVINVVRLKLSEGKELTEICELICDHCLAPDSDGIGRDNMTISIVAILNGRTKEDWYSWVAGRVKQRYGYQTPKVLPTIYSQNRLMRFKAIQQAAEARERAEKEGKGSEQEQKDPETDQQNMSYDPAAGNTKQADGNEDHCDGDNDYVLDDRLKAPQFLIDVHTHVYLPRYASLLRTRTSVPRILSSSTVEGETQERLLILNDEPDGGGRPVGAQYWDRDKKLQFMDRHGIDISIISSANPWLDFLPVSEAHLLAQELNDDLEKFCASSPRVGETSLARLYGFGLLPLVPDTPISSILEAVLHISTLPHLKGVIMGTRGVGKGLDDEALDPVWAAIENAHLVVFLHPHYGVDSNAWGDKPNGHVLPLALGFPFETTIAATRLILSGALDRFPSLRILLAHSGGALPLLSSRLASCIDHDPVVASRLKHDARYYLGRFYFDAVAYGSEELDFVAGVIARSDMYQSGSSDVEMSDRKPRGHRLLFGTDHPFFPPLKGTVKWKSAVDNLDAINALEGWSEEEKDGVRGGNALTLFGLGVEK